MPSKSPGDRSRNKSAGAEVQRPAAGLPEGYALLLDDIKARIRSAQVKAALAANRELIRLYWDVGSVIVSRQREEGWGRAVVERLATDLRAELPGLKGFSPANIWRMRAFYLAWTDSAPDLAQPARDLHPAPILAQPARELHEEILPQLVAELPWFHNVVLIEKLEEPVQRLWYAQETLRSGWSRAVLVHQIESDLYSRHGAAVTNFEATLPPPQSDLARQTVKDPYVFDFLTLDEDAAERQLQRGLVEHLRRFLLELGVGFAFVGAEYHLEVEGEDFYIDLLFYHLRLRCFVVIELKTGPFQPEYAGKMSFYLAAVDDRLRHSADHPSIGIILCKTRKRLIAEYALRNTTAPIGVSEYRLTASLPSEFRDSLPTIEQLEAEFGTPTSADGDAET